MDCILRNASVYRPGGFEQLDLLIRGGIIERMASAIPAAKWRGLRVKRVSGSMSTFLG